MRLDHLLSKESISARASMRQGRDILGVTLETFQYCLILRALRAGLRPASGLSEEIAEHQIAAERQLHGGVAQLGEHLPCTQGVRSSNLLISTIEMGS